MRSSISPTCIESTECSQPGMTAHWPSVNLNGCVRVGARVRVRVTVGVGLGLVGVQAR